MTIFPVATTTHTLASAVADDGTFTVSYPSGFTRADLVGSTGGEVVVDERYFHDQADPGFGFSFGASNITVTNLTGATLAAGSELVLSFGELSTGGRLTPAVAQSPIVSLTAANGTASDTIADVGASFNQTTLNNINQSFATKINAMIAALEAAGIVVD